MNSQKVIEYDKQHLKKAGEFSGRKVLITEAKMSDSLQRVEHNNDNHAAFQKYGHIVIYKALCFNVAQGRMKGAPRSMDI